MDFTVRSLQLILSVVMRSIAITFICTLLGLSISWGATPSERIDELVAAKLTEQGLKPYDSISDDTFLRRTYLSIAGRIPTIEEAEAFHTDSYEQKRERLIEELLDSEAHVSSFYHFWADLLRLNGQPSGTVGAAYQLWIKEQIRENRPYDEIVYDLVTATGNFWDNGATGYYFRDRGMPLDNMSNTVRIFLGTRLECAQCHDHPFDKWTQMDYYSMASFSYGIHASGYNSPMKKLVGKEQREEGMAIYQAKAKEMTGLEKFPYLSGRAFDNYEKNYPAKTEIPEPVEEVDKKGRVRTKKRKVRLTPHEQIGLTKARFLKVAAAARKAEQKHSETFAASRELLSELYDPLQYSSVEDRDRNSKLPHDYQYSDAEPESEVLPAVMFGEHIDQDEIDDSKIEAYGEWMTSSDNPNFTKVIVNRLWKEVFGLGIFEPVDDLTDHTPITNPELLDYLMGLMVELDYDVREFQKVLYNTETYQRHAHTGEVPLGAPYYFAGPTLRRMSAEQIWDSLVTLAIPSADSYEPRLKGQISSIDKVEKIYRSLEERPFDEFYAMVKELAPLVTQRREADNRNRERLLKAQEAGDQKKMQELKNELRSSKRELTQRISEVAYTHLQEKVDGDDLLLAMGLADTAPDQMATSMLGAEEDAGDDDLREVMLKLPKPEIAKASYQPDPNLNKKQQANAKRAWAREQKTNYQVYTRLIQGMARASALESPSRRGHFLRDFGQSDREVIENAADHASVPQALNLLNGQMVDSLTNVYSGLGKRLDQATDLEEKTRIIFQAMLTRQPTETEMELVRAEVAREGDDAYHGIVWALLNTQQFMFVQ